ncbi:hypothetical protein INR49_001663 [Caranx melampygus]|nr:hypothetical protein INR49_001663 [Caranx melampygus]
METDGLRKSIHNLGTIVTTSAVASQSEAMGIGLEQCIIGHPASVTIVTRDKSGGACKSGNAILSAEVFTPDGSIVDGEIVDHKNGTYEFVYTVPKEGNFSLALRLCHPPTTTATNSAANATPSTGSSEGAKRRGKSLGRRRRDPKGPAVPWAPHDAKPRTPLRMTSSSGLEQRRNKGEFTNLQGVAASSTGRILIADSNNQCVQIFSNEGNSKVVLGCGGGHQATATPHRCGCSPSGDIIIADYDNKWVSIFSSDGKYKAKLGSGRLMGPKGVSVDQNGHVIVVDNKACTVFIFQLTGKLIPSPHFAAVNKNNEIIVTDFHNHSVKVLIKCHTDKEYIGSILPVPIHISSPY